MKSNNALTKTLTAGLMHGLKAYVRDSYVDGSHSDYRLAEIKAVDLENETASARYVDWNSNYLFEDIKPLLFPMSALTKEIEFKGERFVPIDKMSEELKLNTVEYCWITANIHQPAFPMKDLRSSVIEWMQKHMFNVDQLSPEEFIEVNETNNPYAV